MLADVVHVNAGGSSDPVVRFDVGKFGDGVEVRASAIAVALEPFGDLVEDGGDDLRGCLGAALGLFEEPVEPAGGRIADPGQDELLLGRELAVEGRLGHARLSDDAIDAGRADAVAMEEAGRCAEDPLSGLGRSRPHAEATFDERVGMHGQGVDDDRRLVAPDVVGTDDRVRGLPERDIEEGLAGSDRLDPGNVLERPFHKDDAAGRRVAERPALIEQRFEAPNSPLGLGPAVEQVDLAPSANHELVALQGLPDIDPSCRQAIEVHSAHRWVDDVDGALSASDALDDEREQLAVEVVWALEHAAYVTPALDFSLSQAERAVWIACRCHQPIVATYDARGKSCILIDRSVYFEHSEVLLRHPRQAKRPIRDDASHRPASSLRNGQASTARTIHRPDDRERVRELLTRALPNAAPETIETLSEAAQLMAVAPGDVVYHQGETIPFTLVIRGYGAFRRTTTDGRQFVFGIASPGWLVGHPGISGRAASTDLVAITPTRVARWSGTEVRALVLADPGLAVSVIDALARLLGMTTERLERFVHQEARGRVLRVLATYADLFFVEPPVLPRTMLPGLVGTSREMTGRVLRSLEAEGVLARVGRRGLRLLAPAALQDAADAAGDAS